LYLRPKETFNYFIASTSSSGVELDAISRFGSRLDHQLKAEITSKRAVIKKYRFNITHLYISAKITSKY